MEGAGFFMVWVNGMSLWVFGVRSGGDGGVGGAPRHYSVVVLGPVMWSNYGDVAGDGFYIFGV